MASSQLREILRDIERHKVMFDGDVVGEKVLDIAMAECLERFRRQEDPDGGAWPELSTDYEAWKAAHGLGMQKGVLWGAMSDDEQFRGERSIAKDEASSEFGVNATAKDHASWFEEGDDSRNRPPRPFTALSAEAIRRIDEFLDSHHAGAL